MNTKLPETGIEKARKKTKKKLPFLDAYLIFCFTFFTLYTVAEFTVSTITGVHHERLTEAVQWVCAGEAFLCCMIKKNKLKKEGNE